MKKATISILLALALLTSACNRSSEARKQQAMERGKRLLTSKDYTRAILEFKTASQADPKDAEAHYNLALAYIEIHDLQSAVGSLRKATELNPGHINAQIKLADILSTASQSDLLKDAVARMEAVLATTPKNPDALRTLAYAEYGLGERDDAEKHLAEAVENGPENLKSAVALAQLKLSQKKPGEAEQILKRVTQQSPPAATPFIVLAGLYIQMQKPADAKRELLQALEIEPDNPLASILLSRLQLQSGEAAEAEKLLKHVSHLSDQRFKSVYAIYLLRSGKRDEALREFERLVSENPKSGSFRQQLISAYMLTGKASEAEKMLTATLKKNPKDVDALLGRTRILLANGKFSEASADLNEVIRFEPNSAVAHYLLSKVHENRRNERSQRQELSEALRLDPALLQARLELSRLMMSTDVKSAAELINETPESQKNDSAVIAQRNWTLLANGDKAGLATAVKQALTVARTPDFVLQDAIVKFQHNDIAGARASLDEVLKTAPEDLRALQLLAETYVVQKQLPAATQRLRQHASANPKSAVAQHFLGGWLQRTGSLAEARKSYLSAKSLNPAYWPTDISIASLDIAEKQFPAARNILTPLVSHPAAGRQARLLLASAEQGAGDGEAALAQYRKVLEEQPDNIYALNNLAYALAEYANAPDEALKIASRAKELAPDNATIDDTLGWVYCKKGLYSNAVQYLEGSVKRQPSAARHAHLAIAYAKRGDKTRAVDQIEAAMKLDANIPEVALAQKALAGR